MIAPSQRVHSFGVSELPGQFVAAPLVRRPGRILPVRLGSDLPGRRMCFPYDFGILSFDSRALRS